MGCRTRDHALNRAASPRPFSSVFKGFAIAPRAARRRMQEIQRMTPKETATRDNKPEKYQPTHSEITEEVVKPAHEKYCSRPGKARGKDLVAELTIDETSQGKSPHYCELGERVIDQARRRVLQGEQVFQRRKKIYSIFENAHRFD